MVTAAKIGAIGGGAAGPGKSLWVDGTNVLKQVGAPGNLFGVPLDSIEHVENGPPGVSSLKFTISDPLKAITLARGMAVHYHNHVTDRPYFRGWVQTWSIQPYGLGRRIAVRCIGVEALLDWMVVPSLTIPTNTRAGEAVQLCVSAALGVGVQLRAFRWDSLTGSGFTSDQEKTIADFYDTFSEGATVKTVVAVVITAKTLREAINAVFAACQVSGFSEFTGPIAAGPYLGVATVDAYFGLRCYGKTRTPDDYAALTVTDTAAGTFVADGLGHAIDVGDVPAGVYVQGGDAGGTGVVPMGDGLPGPIRILNDSTILGATAKRAAGQAYLTDRGAATERGGFDLQDKANGTNVHPASQLVLTDDMTGASGTYLISSITRRFTALRETWHVAYGSLPPSLTRSLRRLTRDTLS